MEGSSLLMDQAAKDCRLRTVARFSGETVEVSRDAVAECCREVMQLHRLAVVVALSLSRGRCLAAVVRFVRHSHGMQRAASSRSPRLLVHLDFLTQSHLRATRRGLSNCNVLRPVTSLGPVGPCERRTKPSVGGDRRGVFAPSFRLTLSLPDSRHACSRLSFARELAVFVPLGRGWSVAAASPSRTLERDVPGRPAVGGFASRLHAD